MTGQDAVQSAKAFHERLSLTGVILTKLDGDARGGAAVSLKHVTGCPILFIGTGEKIDDLDAFHPERMAGRILGMGDVVGLVEQASEKISEEEAQASMEKLVLGSFTLEDMLSQIRMIRKLGPMKKVLGMMPGIGKLADQVDVDDKQMNRLEALFTSMTPLERLASGRARHVAPAPDRAGLGAGRRSRQRAPQALQGHEADDEESRQDGLGRADGLEGQEGRPAGHVALGRAGGWRRRRGWPRPGGLFGGGGPAMGGTDASALQDMLGGGGDPFGSRPMGSSSTRSSGDKRSKQKQKAKAKQKRKNRRKR